MEFIFRDICICRLGIFSSFLLVRLFLMVLFWRHALYVSIGLFVPHYRFSFLVKIVNDYGRIQVISCSLLF